MSVDQVAVLGVGMHPWGKWGRNFVEYGVAAARAPCAWRPAFMTITGLVRAAARAADMNLRASTTFSM